MTALRYTVLCNGEPVGFVDLSAPDEGAAEGLLEPLPAFDRIGPVLERGRRLEEEATMRLFQAWHDGRLPGPTHPPAGADESYLTARAMTPEEAAVFGADALEAGAAAQALAFSLRDPAGEHVPGAEVLFWPYGWPGKGGPERPELSVFVPGSRPPHTDGE